MGGMNLGLGLGLTSGGKSKGPLCQAIERKVCVSAKHKKKTLILAPHVVYGSDTGRLVDAVTIEEDGRTPNKPKLSTFEADKLADVSLTDRAFAPDPGFNPGDIEYSGKIVCIVQVVE